MRPTLPPRRVGWALVVAAALAAPALALTDDAELEPLIRQLGDAEYAIREAAAERLAALGPEAADALLAAAESTPDLEVALKARWLVESLPLAAADDPPEVAAELERFTKADLDARVRIMHRLLRLDGDVGIAPLARIVRQERTPEGARIAAALLAREWAPDDPFWPEVSRRIASGLGASRRPAARFLRAVVTATQPAGERAEAALDEAVAAARILMPPSENEPVTAPDDVDMATLREHDIRRIIRRCLVQLMLVAGRRDAALAEAGQLFADCRELPVEERLVARELAWLADRGLGDAAGLLEERLTADPSVDPRLLYAAAVAFRSRGDDAATARGEPLAARAHAILTASQDFESRRRTAASLAEWGAIDWALREYLAVLDAAAAPVGEFALAGSNCAEFLHDHGRDAEAAEILRRMLAGRPGQADAIDHVLMQEGIDPKSKRSRMHYFAACAAAAAGDAAGHRRLLDEALREDPRDVDALIAAYSLAAAGAEREAVEARVKKALGTIEDQINAVPKDPSAYNEYAWLVANTIGDVRKATAFSKRSLELLADAVGYLEVAAYLDTLAHCRAAAGDTAGAVRTQWLAVRQEPHSPTIRRNYDRFRKASAAP